ncbi:MAG: SurA N-terminal domain-containing protein [Synergistaceae bacterium]|jgi:hypothetical protein|nr:SurA N-terminal domain-containing protein [Synergistaceae bacterium]
MKMDRLIKKSVRPILLFIVIVFVVSCFFMYGAGGSGSGNASQTQGADGSLQDYDVAVIDGEVIKRSRLDMEVEQFINEMGLQENASSTDYPAFRNTVIDQIATLKALDKEIASRKITADKDEVDKVIADLESQFPTREIYFQQLQASGLTEESLRKAVEENVKRRKLLDEVTGVVSTDEAELRNYYEMVKTYAFSKPEGFMMDVAHFKTIEAAETARKELSSGKNWDDVMTAASDDVMDHSDSVNRMFIPENQLTGDTESLKALSMDIPSEVISFTSDDNMIVVKRAREAAGTSSFDEVSADIEQILVSQKRTSLQSQFMQELRTKADVKILDEELFKMPLPETSQDATVSADRVVSSDEVVSADASATSGDGNAN